MALNNRQRLICHKTHQTKSNNLLIALIKLSFGKYLNLLQCILSGFILLLISKLDNNSFMSSAFIFKCPVGWGCRIHRLHICNECSGYDPKQSDGEVLVMLELIGVTILYFKMTVIPLVPETKMVDVGKLISLENLLVRKVT